ncbi:MAG: LysE family translocator, partial [Paracoccaceae bacterium]|nr:LysE family translocator [Paracoccaceae bacterium]
EAVAFQWINPKAWVMAIGISAQFIGVDAPMRSALGLAAVFVLSGLSSAFGWASAGAVLARFLATPARLRIFNVTMSGLIVLGVVWMLRV